jgi:hypothetical protein
MFEVGRSTSVDVVVLMADRVIMLFVDAFSSRYLSEHLCPTMCKLSKEHFYSELEPMFAFQGIGATIFSGAWPNTTGVWAEYVLGENETLKNSLLLQKSMELTDLVPNDRICWDIRYVLFRLWGKKYIGTPAGIPAELIRYFPTKLQKKYSEKDCLVQLKTIFDVLQENGMIYDYLTPSVRTERKETELLCKKLEKGSVPNLSLLHLSSLDGVGHSHGPNSYDVEKAVERTDVEMRNILEASRDSSDDIHIVIFSDHGMSTVRQHLNVWKILRDLPLALVRDYLVFLDSTMARFWFFTSRARRYIEEAFADVECGHVLDTDQLRHLHIDKLGEEHGEMIFAVDDGVAIYPDFFRRHGPPRGMHGYMTPQDNPILLVCSPKSSGSAPRFKTGESARMIDIMPTVLDLLHLPIPTTCEGIRLTE